MVLLDLNSIISANGLTLNPEYDVKDIRILDGVAYFCGRNTIKNDGFVGHVKLSDLSGSVPNSVHCYDLRVGPSTIMWRLAAFDDGMGNKRVVSLGNTWYRGNNAPPFPTCPDSAVCQASFFMEFKVDNDTLVYEYGKVVGDTTRFERADDLVVTNNWLAIVSRYPDQQAIVIHRCKKYDVQNTFDSYYYYVAPYAEGENHCCHMKGDTLADATLYNSGLSSQYESHLRVFDLNSMAMTHAQKFDLLDKTEPVEPTYMPDYATLVVLQYQLYPSTMYHHTFVHWKPYNPSTYFARLMYENTDKSLVWMDRLTNRHIVAAGGDYWMMKDISYDDPSTICYTVDQQQVTPLALSPMRTAYYNYGAIYRRPNHVKNGVPLSIYISGSCITP